MHRSCRVRLTLLCLEFPLAVFVLFFFQNLLAAQDSPDAANPFSSASSASTQDLEETPSAWWEQPNVGYGPFHQAALGFFNSLRLGFAPRPPVVLSQGSFEARVTESWAKVISEADGAYNLDYEILRTQASLAYGLTDTTVIDLDFDTATRVHGILDPLMIAFHNTFGIPLGPRGQLPNNSFRIELNPGEGHPPVNLDNDSGRPFTRAIVLTAQQALTYGDEGIPAVALSLSLRPNLDDFEPIQGGGPLDLSVGASVSKSLGDFTLYLSGDFSWYGDENFGGTPLPSTQWGVLAALEWHCLDRFSLVVQCLSMKGLVDTFVPFSRPSFEVCGGAKWELAPDFRIDFGLLHAVENPANAPDFGFQLELLLRW
jgi:hypothetical protein